MEFEFFFKLIITCCFMAVTTVLCCKWIIETYLDYKVTMLEAEKAEMEQILLEQATVDEDDDDFTTY